MTKKSDKAEVEASAANNPSPERRMQVGVRLESGAQSAQPVLCNFSGAATAGGLLLLEFGFLEPGGLNAIARAAQAGENPPDSIGGHRICRLALLPDTAAQLAQQLNHFLSTVANAQAKQQ